MKLIWIALFAVVFVGSANAQTVIAARTIPSNAVLSHEDLALSDREGPVSALSIERLVGMETSVIIYAGQNITPEALRLPTMVERNSKVVLEFVGNGLQITTDGRALGRASYGEQVQVLNLSSRNTVTGIATYFGRVTVGDHP